MGYNVFAGFGNPKAPPQIEPDAAPVKTEPITEKPKQPVGRSGHADSSAKRGKPTRASETRKRPDAAANVPAPSIPESPESPESAQNRTSDPSGDQLDVVMAKAKSAVAANFENPASVEFIGANRAVRKNILGQPVDTICGRARGKTASGENTGERPFFYFVKDDEAFVVDDPADRLAADVYHDICR